MELGDYASNTPKMVRAGYMPLLPPKCLFLSLPNCTVIRFSIYMHVYIQGWLIINIITYQINYIFFSNGDVGNVIVDFIA